MKYFMVLGLAFFPALAAATPFTVDGSTVYVSGGLMGIGTSTPAYTLHVMGTGYTTGQQIVGGTMTVAGNAFSVGATTFAVMGGFVGIKTTPATYDLSVASQINVGTGLCINGDCRQHWNTGTGTANTITKWTAGSALGNSDMTDDGNSITASQPVTVASTLSVTGSAFSVGGATLAVVGGNVGIGTASPKAGLEINGTARMDGMTTFPSGSTITFTSGAIINSSQVLASTAVYFSTITAPANPVGSCITGSTITLVLANSSFLDINLAMSLTNVGNTKLSVLMDGQFVDFPYFTRAGPAFILFDNAASNGFVHASLQTIYRTMSPVSPGSHTFCVFTISNSGAVLSTGVNFFRVTQAF
jgi:hypothetical protein